MDYYICKHCGFENDKESTDVSADETGFWCNDCDTLNYFDCDRKDKDHFLLILEEKSSENVFCNKAPIPLNKRLSPLRYPGGKSKFADYVYWQMQGCKMKKFVEPFAGGGSVGLAFLDAGLVESLVLNDSDYGIYSLFNQMKNGHKELIEALVLIDKQGLTREKFFESRKIIESDYKGCNELQAAVACIVVNRLAYSGICKANPLGGKNGTREEMLARWNLPDLVRRIESIHNMSHKIKVTNEDAYVVIEEEYWDDEATLFIDPPYFKKGKALYNHYFDMEDHERLSGLLLTLYHSCGGADIVITYDSDPYIKELYRHPILIEPEVKLVDRFYSVGGRGKSNIKKGA